MNPLLVLGDTRVIELSILVSLVLSIGLFLEVNWTREGT
jgi:hypothetical protein